MGQPECVSFTSLPYRLYWLLQPWYQRTKCTWPMLTLWWAIRPCSRVCYRPNWIGPFRSRTGWLDLISSMLRTFHNVKRILFLFATHVPPNNFFVETTADSKYAVIGGNLHVTNVQLEDTRLTYRCFTKNRLDGQQASSPAGRIVLKTRDAMTTGSDPSVAAPQLNQPPLTIIHNQLGHDILLPCNVQGLPVPKIRSVFLFIRLNFFKVLQEGLNVSQTDGISGICVVSIRRHIK